MAEGKHHIGDFLPPDELKKFMETYKVVRGFRWVWTVNSCCIFAVLLDYRRSKKEEIPTIQTIKSSSLTPRTLVLKCYKNSAGKRDKVWEKTVKASLHLSTSSQTTWVLMILRRCLRGRVLIWVSKCFRGKTSLDAGGIGVEKSDELKQEDSEFDMYRKRMMLAYKFRPNPMVRIQSRSDRPTIIPQKQPENSSFS